MITGRDISDQGKKERSWMYRTSSDTPVVVSGPTTIGTDVNNANGAGLVVTANAYSGGRVTINISSPETQTAYKVTLLSGTDGPTDFYVS